jgi:hypothetical protein
MSVDVMKEKCKGFLKFLAIVPYEFSTLRERHSVDCKDETDMVRCGSDDELPLWLVRTVFIFRFGVVVSSSSQSSTNKTVSSRVGSRHHSFSILTVQKLNF